MGRHTEQLKEQMDRATQHFHRRDNEVGCFYYCSYFIIYNTIILYCILLFYKILTIL